ncbi:DUF2845 domain-containing protein [Dyella soli]
MAAHAGSGTLRVGSQVLVVGDSAARVLELLGKPAYKAHGRATSGSRKGGRSSGHAARMSAPPGEHWQYRSGGRVITVIVVDGRVSAIRDDGR